MSAAPPPFAEPELGSMHERSLTVITAICANCGELIWQDRDFGVWSHMKSGDRRCALWL